MRSPVISLLIVFLSFSSFAQKIRCAVESKMEENMEMYRAIQDRIENIRNEKARKSVSHEILRIPVVVHVIHNNNTGMIGGSDNPNISDDQVFSQIEVLNEDFRRMPGTAGFNDHPVGADMGIEFFLANIDPDGQPTTGINRIFSPKRSFNVYTDLEILSELAYWDSNRYLNIWVCHLAGNIIGYAEMPIADFAGLETEDTNEIIDGIFVDHSVFGRGIGTVSDPFYSEGRTTTHEVGHWLGLIHVWGDRRCGDDFCDDTPPAEGPNLTDGCGPIYSFCNRTESLNMIENFMDYSPDYCMNIFTQDQKARTRAILELSKRRKKLIENAVIFEPIKEPIIVKIMGNPVESPFLSLQILVNQPKDFRLYLIDELGRVVLSSEYKNSLSRLVQIPKTVIGKGMLIMKLHTDKESLTERIFLL